MEPANVLQLSERVSSVELLPIPVPTEGADTEEAEGAIARLGYPS